MSVKRHWMTPDTGSVTQWHQVVLASDYDALVEELRCLLSAGDMIHDEDDCHQDCPWVKYRSRLLALIGEKGV